MRINVYEGRAWDKGGNAVHLGEARAFNKSDASRMLGCFPDDVKIVRKHVRLLDEEVIARIFITHHPAHIDKAVAHVRKSMGVSKTSSTKKKKKRKS